MNIEEKALSMFRAEPYRYNCAQTVCAALERMDLVEPLSACSGGRAPDGLCGALIWSASMQSGGMPRRHHGAFCGQTGLFPVQGVEKGGPSLLP